MLNITFCHFSWLHSLLHVLHSVIFLYEDLRSFFFVFQFYAVFFIPSRVFQIYSMFYSPTSELISSENPLHKTKNIYSFIRDSPDVSS